MNQSDLELVNQIKNGNIMAWAMLFDRYKVMLYYQAYFTLRNREDAEDVLQEYIMELWRKRGRWEINTNVKAYLRTAIKRRSVDTLRRLRVDREHSRKYLLTATDTVFNDNRLEVADLKEVFQHAFDLLPDALRQTMKMIFIEHKTKEEAALLLNVHYLTVGKYIIRAFKLLKKNPQLIGMYQLFFRQCNSRK